jgi:hypothetical protein
MNSGAAKASIPVDRQRWVALSGSSNDPKIRSAQMICTELSSGAASTMPDELAGLQFGHCLA